MSTRLFVQVCVVSFLLQGAVSFAAVNPVGFIDTTDSCLIVNKVTPTEIHLISAGKCDGKEGRAFVELKPGEIRDVFVDGEPIGKQSVRPLEIVDITATLEKGKKDAAAMKLPENKHVQAMELAAKTTSEFYYSQEFQDKLKTETDRIKGSMFGDQVASYYKDVATDASGKVLLGDDERLYIFVSSSMPTVVLRTYAADIARLKDPRVVMVVRGFIEGMAKIGPTLSFFADVLKKKSSCNPNDGQQCEMNSANLIVDPMLFRKYAVNQVPAFVYAKGLQLDNPGMSEGVDEHISKQGESYKIIGDASLGYIVSRFADESGSKALVADGRILR